MILHKNAVEGTSEISYFPPIKRFKWNHKTVTQLPDFSHNSVACAFQFIFFILRTEEKRLFKNKVYVEEASERERNMKDYT